MRRSFFQTRSCTETTRIWLRARFHAFGDCNVSKWTLHCEHLSVLRPRACDCGMECAHRTNPFPVVMVPSSSARGNLLSSIHSILPRWHSPSIPRLPHRRTPDKKHRYWRLVTNIRGRTWKPGPIQQLPRQPLVPEGPYPFVGSIDRCHLRLLPERDPHLPH